MGWSLQKEQKKDEDTGYDLYALHRDIDRKETSQDLSAASLSYTTDISDKWAIAQVLIHADGTLTETIKVYFDSLSGSDYDTLIAQGEFDSNQDLGFVAGDNMLSVIGEDGDEIRIESNGEDSTRTLYVTVIYEKLK